MPRVLGEGTLQVVGPEEVGDRELAQRDGDAGGLCLLRENLRDCTAPRPLGDVTNWTLILLFSSRLGLVDVLVALRHPWS